MKLPHIKNITKCNHCGSAFGYYQKQFMSGWIQDNTLFETGANSKREKYNPEMWDSLNSGKYNPTCYCMDCDKPIGTLPKEDIGTF
jgi:hypothetical protein